MIALALMALASLPGGGKIPDAFIGKYALIEVTKADCDVQFALSIRQDQLRLRGTDYAIIMEEKIDDRNIHVWLHDPADKTNKIIEFHLYLETQGGGGVVLVSDADTAESAVEYGKPAADAGVAGLFLRCPA